MSEGNFGRWLRTVRRERGVRYAGTEVRRKLDRGTVLYWERGRVRPTRKNLELFARTMAGPLGVQEEEIFLRAGYMPGWWIREVNRRDHPLDLQLQLALLSVLSLPAEDQEKALDFLRRKVEEMVASRPENKNTSLYHETC